MKIPMIAKSDKADMYVNRRPNVGLFSWEIDWLTFSFPFSQVYKNTRKNFGIDD